MNLIDSLSKAFNLREMVGREFQSRSGPEIVQWMREYLPLEQLPLDKAETVLAYMTQVVQAKRYHQVENENRLSRIAADVVRAMQEQS